MDNSEAVIVASIIALGLGVVLYFIAPKLWAREGYPPFSRFKNICTAAGCIYFGFYCILRAWMPDLFTFEGAEMLTPGTQLYHWFWCWHDTSTSILGYLMWVAVCLMFYGRFQMSIGYMKIAWVLTVIFTMCLLFVVWNDYNRDLKEARGCLSPRSPQFAEGRDR